MSGLSDSASGRSTGEWCGRVPKIIEHARISTPLPLVAPEIKAASSGPIDHNIEEQNFRGARTTGVQCPVDTNPGSRQGDQAANVPQQFPHDFPSGAEIHRRYSSRQREPRISSWGHRRGPRCQHRTPVDLEPGTILGAEPRYALRSPHRNGYNDSALLLQQAACIGSHESDRVRSSPP